MKKDVDRLEQGVEKGPGLTVVGVGRAAVDKPVIRIGRHLVLLQLDLVFLQPITKQTDDFLHSLLRGVAGSSGLGDILGWF
jgi:hypothetical protein